MPGFGDDSPSFAKMDLNNGRFGGAKKSFNFANIAGDPFSLATIGIAIVSGHPRGYLSGHRGLTCRQCGWLIAFVSSILADVSEEYPNFAWWTLVYMLGCIIGVFVTVATNSVATYHVAIVGFLAAGLVFTTSSVNSTIYYNDGAKEAAAAGFILLSMVAVRPSPKH